MTGDMNGHFASIGRVPTQAQYEHGLQVIDEDKTFKYVNCFAPFAHDAARNTYNIVLTGVGLSGDFNAYLQAVDVADAGFNYHLISVFGSQSTGKSTLLNHLFGTEFNVMSEAERRQTTKGIWLSKNKKGTMADNVLVMDVEGTDGRERGEDQDFERKSALFALATSEVLIVNIWEHQVGLYQGANMGLLKTVFEVNLQLFLKDKQ
jgi:protein SEY1